MPSLRQRELPQPELPQSELPVSDPAVPDLPDAPLHADDAPAGGRAFWLRADDGQRLRLAHWPAPPEARGHVLLLPGRTEWIEKYALVVGDLARAGWGAFVLDWRGQGLSDRMLADRRIGHVLRFADYQADLAAARATAATLAPGPLPVLAHSMGGCILLRALVEGWRPPAVAFSAPMWGVAQSPAMRLALRAGALLGAGLRRDGGYVPSTGPDYGLTGTAFADNPLTRDRAQFERMKAQLVRHPDLAIGGPSLRFTGAALGEVRGLARLPSPPVPALIGLGGHERIVSAPAIRARAAAWTGAELVEYPQAEHELLMEVPEVRDDFLRRSLAHFAAHVPAAAASSGGATGSSAGATESPGGTARSPGGVAGPPGGVNGSPGGAAGSPGDAAR